MVTTSAGSLIVGDRVYIQQIHGGTIAHKTPATIIATWQHGPLVTILIEGRGYAELDVDETLDVA